MRRHSLSLFIGPNLHSRRPLVRLEMDAAGTKPLTPSELTARLEQTWPKGERWAEMADLLTDLAEAKGELDGMAAIGLLAHFTQGMVLNPDLKYWHESASESGRTLLFVEAEWPRPARLSALFACEAARLLFDAEQPEDAETTRAELARLWRRFARERQGREFNNITTLLTDCARKRGVPVSPYFPDNPMAVLGQGHRRRRMVECFGDSTSLIANLIARDKTFTAGLLASVGVPVPKQRQVLSQDDLDRAIEDIGFPLVIKGRTGSKGDSVTANIRSPEEIPAAVEKAKQAGQEILVENHVAGEDFRLTVIDGKLIAAARRVPAHVIGDGQQSIAELIAAENARRATWDSPYAAWVQRLVLDEDMRGMLARQGLTPESTPEAGQRIALRTAGNFSLGGTAEDVTDEVHPSVVEVMERAARCLGLDMAGVDLLSPDITADIRSVTCAVNEVNNFPSPRAHYITPTPPRDVAGAIIDHLFPAPQRGRIPMIALMSQDAPEIALRLRRLLAACGVTAGSATQDGLHLGEERLTTAKDLGAVDTAVILQDPAVEAAVLQVSPAQVRKEGLAWDACDIAVIDGRMEDDEIAGLVASLTGKALVLDAAAPALAQLARRYPELRAIWVGQGEPLPDLEGDWLLFAPETSRASLHPQGHALSQAIVFDLSLNDSAPSMASLLALAAALSLGMDPAALQSALSGRASVTAA